MECLEHHYRLSTLKNPLCQIFPCLYLKQGMKCQFEYLFSINMFICMRYMRVSVDRGRILYILLEFKLCGGAGILSFSTLPSIWFSKLKWYL